MSNQNDVVGGAYTPVMLDAVRETFYDVLISQVQKYYLGEFDTVRMPYLGKFTVKPGRVKMLNNKNAIIQRRKLSGDN